MELSRAWRLEAGEEVCDSPKKIAVLGVEKRCLTLGREDRG